MPKNNIEEFRVVNPVKITKEQIQVCLVNAGMNEETAAFKAANSFKLMQAFVSDKYQAEVDHYLQTQEIMNSECGKSIESTLLFNMGNFFDALIAYAMKELENEGVI